MLVRRLVSCGKKTFFLSMLMACAVRRQVLGLERIREEPLRVLWYDTDQSRYTMKRILTGRIGTSCSLSKNFFRCDV